jgi:hypothetical protein
MLHRPFGYYDVGIVHASAAQGKISLDAPMLQSIGAYDAGACEHCFII